MFELVRKFAHFHSDQQIEKAKFMLHEAYCLRHMYKCKWGEVVHKTEKEEHEEEKHVKLKCKYCGWQEMKHLFLDHEDKCEQKPKEWQFCEQTIEFSQFLQHVNFCGAKTRTWEFCKRNIMMRNQKYHEETEWAKFLREEFEKEEAKKIKELEEEEKRKEKVNEMQKARRMMKEDKEKAKILKEVPKPTPVVANPVVKEKRVLPSYIGNGTKSNQSKVQKEEPKPKKPAPTKASEGYKPSYRSKKTKPNEDEDAKYQKSDPKPTKPSAISSSKADKYVGSFPKESIKPKDTKYKNYDELQLNQYNDDLPAELLNKIYSEDMDDYEFQKLQSKEYEDQNRPVSRQPQRLIEEDVEMIDEFSAPRRMENRPRNRSPPIRPPAAASTELEQNENELLQKAIEESLKQYNPRFDEMGK